MTGNNPDFVPQTALPTDPLESLGDSTFLYILSYLPPTALATVTAVCKAWRFHSLSHKSGIWRDACRRSGIDPARIKTQGSLEKHITIDWRRLCLGQQMLSRNQRLGRCKDEWLHKAGARGKIWQFQYTARGDLVTTNQDCGLRVIGRCSSEVVFAIMAVRKCASIEICNDFVIIDPYEGRDTLQVYRTRMNIAQSTRKFSSARSLPPTVNSSGSLTQAWSYDSALAPEYAQKTEAEGRRAPEEMPREALAFYREIFPPTHCNIFRGRAEPTHGGRRRGTLIAGGEGGVYLWDLEDDEREPDVYRFPEGVRVGVKSLELDDSFIFVGGIQQVHIFDRRSKDYILAFPPLDSTLPGICAAIYTFAAEDVAPIFPPPPPLEVPLGGVGHSFNSPSVIGRAEIPGFSSTAERYSSVLEGGGPVSSALETTAWTSRTPSEEATMLSRLQGFIACRLTATDLICATRTGQHLIVREFASILALPDPHQRQHQIAQNTILLKLGKKIRLLATKRDLITISTSKRVFFLESTTLPSLPLPNRAETKSETPPIRLHCSLDISNREAESATCAQIHGNTVYYSYTASGIGRPALLDNQKEEEPERRLLNETGPGLWVRGWDFSYYEEYVDNETLRAELEAISKEAGAPVGVEAEA